MRGEERRGEERRGDDAMRFDAMRCDPIRSDPMRCDAIRFYIIYILCFCIQQDPSMVLCGRDAHQFKGNFDLITASKSKPVPYTNVFSENNCPYSTINLSEFHIVFSSSAIICFNKDEFGGHLCQAVNNFVKQN